MGEMASSVAHELNQPLTAITNYCNGMVSRVKADSIGRDDLVAALEDRRQAERAGQIIHRIRAFVKKSEPQRQPARRRARSSRTPSSWPASSCDGAMSPSTLRGAAPAAAALVDPILIEQVLLNLLKNAAEAIDRPPSCRPARRHIELRSSRHTPEEGGVIEFSVTDMGPGLPERSARAPVRGVLLHQARRHGHRAVAVPLDHRVAPRAGSAPRTSTMATP